MNDVNVLQVVEHLLLGRLDLLYRQRDILSHFIACALDVLAYLRQLIQIELVSRRCVWIGM